MLQQQQQQQQQFGVAVLPTLATPTSLSANVTGNHLMSGPVPYTSPAAATAAATPRHSSPVYASLQSAANNLRTGAVPMSPPWTPHPDSVTTTTVPVATARVSGMPDETASGMPVVPTVVDAALGAIPEQRGPAAVAAASVATAKMETNNEPIDLWEETDGTGRQGWP